jgi:hypothetical protein
MANSIEIKSPESGADAPVVENQNPEVSIPEIEVVDQMGVPTARTKPEEDPTSRPEWLPEKFKSAEDLAKAYSELEKKLSNPREENQEFRQETQNKETPEIIEVSKEEADALRENADVDRIKSHDFSKYSEEWAEKGELSPESFNELESMGIPKDFVSRYIEGVEAVQDRQVSEIYNTVGGERNYKEMVEWAANNLSKDEVDAYDDIVSGNELSSVRLAAKGLWAQYVAQNGKAPKLIGGSQSMSGSVSPFRSTAEVVAAMADTRYANDPAYRRDVEKRLEISDVL